MIFPLPLPNTLLPDYQSASLLDGTAVLVRLCFHQTALTISADTFFSEKCRSQIALLLLYLRYSLLIVQLLSPAEHEKLLKTDTDPRLMIIIVH